MNKSKPSLTNVSNLLKFSRINERDEFNLENIIEIDADDVDKKLKEIDSKIENIGILCDKKRQKTYEELSSIFKREKSKITDKLSKLNLVLNDTVK